MKYSTESVMHKLLGHLSPEAKYAMYKDYKKAEMLSMDESVNTYDPDDVVEGHLMSIYYDHLHNLVYAVLREVGIDTDTYDDGKMDKLMTQGAYEVMDEIRAQNETTK